MNEQIETTSPSALEALIEENKDLKNRLFEANNSLKVLKRPSITVEVANAIHRIVCDTMKNYDFEDERNYEFDFEIDYDNRLTLSNLSFDGIDNITDEITDTILSLFNITDIKDPE
jgi:hypothetical protein